MHFPIEHGEVFQQSLCLFTRVGSIHDGLAGGTHREMVHVMLVVTGMGGDFPKELAHGVFWGLSWSGSNYNPVWSQTNF